MINFFHLLFYEKGWHNIERNRAGHNVYVGWDSWFFGLNTHCNSPEIFSELHDVNLLFEEMRESCEIFKKFDLL